MATRQASLSCEDFAFMQAVTLATSGMTSEQSRIASGVQAWRVGVAALGGRAVETTKQHSEQGNGAGQVNDPHVDPLGLATFCAGGFAHEIGRRLAQSKS